MEARQDAIPLVASRTLALLIEVVERHVELAKEELQRDAKAMAWNVASIVFGVPAIGLGYVFLCVAVASALAPWLGTTGGLAVIGAANLLVGGVALAWGTSRIRHFHPLDETLAEIRLTAHALAPLPSVNAQHDEVVRG